MLTLRYYSGEYEVGNGRNVFCKGAGCQSSPYIPCRSDHANPISLIWTNDEVPAYYRKIVQFCRSASPQQRLPAADLLLLFPTAFQQDINKEKSGVIYSFPSPGKDGISCDICLEICHGYHYHCNICSGGDFDICKKCIEAGKHCLKRDHVLLERLTLRHVGANVLTGKQIWSSESGDEK